MATSLEATKTGGQVLWGRGDTRKGFGNVSVTVFDIKAHSVH